MGSTIHLVATPLLRDVDRDSHHVSRLAGPVALDRPALFHPSDLAVAAYDAELRAFELAVHDAAMRVRIHQVPVLLVDGLEEGVGRRLDLSVNAGHVSDAGD